MLDALGMLPRALFGAVARPVYAWHSL